MTEGDGFARVVFNRTGGNLALKTGIIVRTVESSGKCPSVPQSREGCIRQLEKKGGSFLCQASHTLQCCKDAVTDGAVERSVGSYLAHDSIEKLFTKLELYITLVLVCDSSD